MSEKDYSLVTGKAGTVVAENLKVTLATAGAGSLSPATITAMVGIAQNSALKIADDVQSSMSTLAAIAASMSPANVAAASTLSSMQALQSSLGFGGSPNQAAFGSILQQAVQHCKDSVQLKQCTDFLESVDYSSFGSGISDMGSMAERGLTSVMGSLSAAGAAMASTGSMFNGIDVKDFGSPLGLVKSLQANKLANATGVNAKLSAAGVPLSDIDNPIYADKISQVMASIKDPAAINAAAEQFNIANPFGGLPSYNGNDGSLYSTPSFLGGASTNTSNFVEGSVTQGTSTASSAIGAGLSSTGRSLTVTKPVTVSGGNWSVTGTASGSNVNYVVFDAKGDSLTDGTYSYVTNLLQGQIASGNFVATYTNVLGVLASVKAEIEAGTGNATLNGGIQSLKDLSDPSKLAPPGSIAGFSGAGALAQKFKDMGAGTIGDAQVAGSFFSSIKTAATPLMSAAHSSLNSLMTDLKPSIDNLIGAGTGANGLPSVVDFTQHVSGGPAVTSFLDAVKASGGNVLAIDAGAISSLSNSVTASQSLFTTAGIDLGTSIPNSLSTAMSFATNLKKFGQDTLTGVGPVLQNMADTSTKWGESVKASLAEGYNDKLLAANGLPPLNSNPFSGLPSDPTADPVGNAAKLLGG